MCTDLNIDDNRLILKRIIENGELPRYIYKYATIKTTLLILNSSKIKFSKPSKFNDPFDCNITVDTNNSEKEINDYIDSLKKTQNLTQKYVEALRIQCHNPVELQRIADKSIKEVKKAFGVTCFSKNKDNLIMWAHYSDKHKGVCLKFDILGDPDFFMIPFLVNYTKDYPLINFIREFKSLAKLFLETKSIDWAYENEVRILKKGADYYPFNKKSLVEIIFGARSQQDDREKIIKSAQIGEFVDISFNISKISDTKFELCFQRIN